MSFTDAKEQEILTLFKRQDQLKQDAKLINILSVEQALRKAAFKHGNIDKREDKLSQLNSFRKYIQNDTSLAFTYDEYYDNRNKIFLTILKALGNGTIEANQHKWHKVYKLDLEDCKAMIYAGILHAIDNFTLARPTECKFSSYMWLCISQYFQRYYIKNGAQRRSPKKMYDALSGNTPQRIADENHPHDFASFHIPLESPIEEDTQLADIIPGQEDIDSELSYKILIENLYAQLPNEQDRLLLEYMLNGEKRKDISTKLNISLSQTNEELRRIKNKVKKLLKKQI